MDYMDYRKVRQGYKEFLSQWEWEVFATLTFKRPVPFDEGFKIAKQWLGQIKSRVGNKTKFAGILIKGVKTTFLS